MKTNIRLRVTPKQSKSVQKICFNNKIYWAAAGSNFEEDNVRYIFIDIDVMTLTYDSTFFHKHKFEEIDADLFIRTNGTCVESTETLTEECQFTKYGFEKPAFECELFGTVSDSFRKNSFVIGVIKKGIFNNCPHMWSVKYGTCYTSSLASNMPEYNLTPIKKPWYETCKFPCLVKDKDATFLLDNTEGYSERYLQTLTPLTNDEIEELKQ